MRLRLVDARVMVELGLAWLRCCAWVRAELRLTEGSVLLTMGEPMGNDSVMFGWGDSVKPREIT